MQEKIKQRDKTCIENWNELIVTSQIKLPDLGHFILPVFRFRYAIMQANAFYKNRTTAFF